MKAVLFDFDGVLADTGDAIVAAFKKAMQEAGYEITAGEVRKYWGQGPFMVAKRFFQSKRIRKSEMEMEQIAKRKTFLQARMGGRNKLMPGVKPLLRALKKKGMLIGVASSNRRALVKAFLKHYNIGGFFKGISSAEAGDRPKPFPDQYLKASELLKVKPRECIAVEDMVRGVKAARKAGMKVIAVGTGFDSRKELKKAKPDLFVQSLREKKRMLEFVSS